MLQRVLTVVILTQVSNYLLIVDIIKCIFLVCKLVLYIPEQLNWGFPFLHCWSIFLFVQVKCNDLPQTANNFMPAKGKRAKIVNVLFNWDVECISPENGGSSHFNSFNCSCVELATWKIIIGKVNFVSC